MTVVFIIHLTIAAVWLGSMIYSLVVVQPRVDRFFPDLERREEFLQTLANGNRRPVVALIGGLLLTDLAILVAQPEARIGYGIALPLYLLAGGLRQQSGVGPGRSRPAARSSARRRSRNGGGPTQGPWSAERLAELLQRRVPATVPAQNEPSSGSPGGRT